MASSSNLEHELRPRISFGSWAFSFGPFASDPWPFDRVCEYAAEAGYTGIEINGFRPHPHHHDFRSDRRLDALVRLFDRTGLAPAVYAPDLSAAAPADEPTAYLAELDTARRFCEQIGITILRVDTVSPPETLAPAEFQRRFERLVSTWQEAARRCAASGVTIAWEFEPGFWLNRPSDVVRLVQKVDEPSFRILFDTCHAYTGAVAGARQGPEPELLEGGEVEYARLLEPYVGHVHLIDSDGSLHDDETSAHVPFGAGNVDFSGVLAALRPTLDTLDWLGVDFCFCASTENDARVALPYVTSLVRGLAEAAA